MIKRVVFFIVFLSLQVCVYVISSLFYSREISALPETILYYSVLVLFVIFVDLIKIRRVKWLILILINLVVITFVVLGAYAPDISSIYLLVVMSPLNVPFLPRLNLNIDNKILRVVVFYLLYFLLPVIYWYGLYILSNRVILRKFLKIK